MGQRLMQQAGGAPRRRQPSQGRYYRVFQAIAIYCRHGVMLLKAIERIKPLRVIERKGKQRADQSTSQVSVFPIDCATKIPSNTEIKRVESLIYNLLQTYFLAIQITSKPAGFRSLLLLLARVAARSFDADREVSSRL